MPSDPSYSDERAANRAHIHRITIETRVPSKWRFCDLETGQIWMWEDDKFKTAQDISVETIGDTPKPPAEATVVPDAKKMEDLVDHIMTNIVDPIKLVKSLKEAGVKVSLGVAYLGEDTPEGYVDVECSGCGAKAKLPQDKVQDEAVLMCPDCTTKQEDAKKYEGFDPSEFD